MNTIIRPIDEENWDTVIGQAAGILAAGGLVAFPTETVYGLGGDGLRRDAARKIYAAKGRPSDNPLILHIADASALGKLAEDIPAEAYRLAEVFWPGPLTVILKKKDIVPYETTGGLETVAVRMPSHPAARSLIERSGLYIAAPSANLSGRPSPTRAEHVIEDMQGRIDMIIDAGAIEIGLESTIVDLTAPVPTVLRPGFITADMIKEVLGDVCFDKTVLAKSAAEGTDRPKAPGMKYRHYAPRADMIIVEGTVSGMTARINELAGQYVSEGKKVGILASAENAAAYPAGQVVVVGSRQDNKEIASRLFDVLRTFDRMETDIILSECFSCEELGQAVMNRLIKAAGYHIITAD